MRRVMRDGLSVDVRVGSIPATFWFDSGGCGCNIINPEQCVW